MANIQKNTFGRRMDRHMKQIMLLRKSVKQYVKGWGLASFSL